MRDLNRQFALISLLGWLAGCAILTGIGDLERAADLGGVPEAGLADVQAEIDDRDSSLGETDANVPGVDSAPTCVADFSSDAKHCGRCGHSCLGGACQNAVCQPFVLASGQDAPSSVVADENSVYWVNQSFSDTPGEVRARNLSDGSPERIVASGLQRPIRIVMDAENLYWTESVGKSVRSIPKKAGLTTLPRTLVSNQAAFDIVRDGDTLYFTTLFQTEDQVVAIRTDGGGARTVAKVGPSAAIGLAVDQTTVFFGDLFNGSIYRVPKTGGTPTSVDIGASGTFSLAIDAERVYAAAFVNGRIAQRFKDGGCVDKKCSDVVSGQLTPMFVMTVAGKVCWATRGSHRDGGPTSTDGIVACAESDGTNRTDLAVKQAAPTAIFADERAFFWTLAGTSDHDDVNKNPLFDHKDGVVMGMAR